MAHVLYQCPRTGLRVQTWVEEQSGVVPGAAKNFQAVQCPACSQLHFVNHTGDLLGHGKK